VVGQFVTDVPVRTNTASTAPMMIPATASFGALPIPAIQRANATSIPMPRIRIITMIFLKKSSLN